MSQDCATPPAGLTGYEEALQRLVAAAHALPGHDRVPLVEALGRTLAEPVLSQIAVPGWDYSAMDGYALRAEDASLQDRLPVSQRIPAGTSPDPLAPGTAARIFTGAPIPDGADTVVIQEQCSTDGDQVLLPESLTFGANIRRRGEDIQDGAVVLTAGTRLQPAHIGLAASVGAADLSVCKRPRVALFASGDELVMPGQPLSAGKIYNSNLFTATALLQALGCQVIDLGIVEDSFEATRDALLRGAESADLVLASGGVSVGEEDHVKPAVESLGSLDMWQIAIRPGKPLAFGRIGETAFIGSPGNPVSLFITFVLLVRPFVLRLVGRSDWRVAAIPAIADFEWKRPDKRREFHRARLRYDDDGTARVSVHPSRSSGVLSSVVWANGLVDLAEGRTVVPGQRVDFLPFIELMQ